MPQHKYFGNRILTFLQNALAGVSLSEWHSGYRAYSMQALKRLDVPPSQVLIEASIVEVTLNDDLQYGLQWAFSEQKNGGIGQGVLSRAAGAALGSTPAGFSYTWASSTGDVRAVLNALADKSLVKVISSPSLMVMDNHTASIAVGTQQPVQSPEDLKGLKMRTVPADLPQQVATAVGAAPTPIPWPELFTSLQTGVVEGTANGITDIMSMKFTDAGIKYLTLDGHSYMGAFWWMGNDRFKSLTPEQQQIVVDGFAALQQAETTAMQTAVSGADPHAMVQCRAQPDTLWVQHHNAIFMSSDAGRNFTEIVDVKPSVFGFPVVVHPREPDTAWFAPEIKDERRIPVGGRLVVTRTRDGGRSVEVLGDGLPRRDAYDLVYRHALDVADDGATLAMGSTTGHLWLSRDAGASWTLIAGNLPPIACVRFAA